MLDSSPVVSVVVQGFRVVDHRRERWCPRGQHWVRHDIEHFYYQRGRSFNLRQVCKACMREYARDKKRIERAAA